MKILNLIILAALILSYSCKKDIGSAKEQTKGNLQKISNELLNYVQTTDAIIDASTENDGVNIRCFANIQFPLLMAHGYPYSYFVEYWIFTSGDPSMPGEVKGYNLTGGGNGANWEFIPQSAYVLATSANTEATLLEHYTGGVTYKYVVNNSTTWQYDNNYKAFLQLRRVAY